MLAQLLADPFLIFGTFGLIGGLIGVLLSIFWIWMLIEAIMNPSLNGTEKLIWVVVILFLHFVGALIYFFVARSGTSRPIV